MANGRPGDHPFQDVVHYKLNVFGAEVDDKIRLLNSKGTPGLRVFLSDIVWYWPVLGGQPAEIGRLSAILDSLKSYAQIPD